MDYLRHEFRHPHYAADDPGYSGGFRSRNPTYRSDCARFARHPNDGWYVDITQAVQGLSNKAVVTVGCMFVLSRALVKTGLLEAAAHRLSNWLGSRRWMAVSILLLAVSLFSGFLNNNAIVAIFIPLVMTLCRRLRLSPSKVLIPLSYSAIVGGTLTLIGTSTNLLVSAMAEDAGNG